VLSIAAMTSGAERYYASLAREDYYTEGGEPPGVYAGSGATALGLEGKASKNALRNLFAGRSANGKDELVQRQVGEGRAVLRRRFGAHPSGGTPKATDEDGRNLREQVHGELAGTGRVGCVDGCRV
jgi:hypothetical protein